MKAKLDMVDKQDYEMMDQRCQLFLYEYPTITTEGKLKLQLGALDNVNIKYPLPFPMYQINARNFVNPRDEVEKIDYQIQLPSEESSSYDHTVSVNEDSSKLEKGSSQPDSIQESNEQPEVDEKLSVFDGSFAILNDLSQALKYVGIEADSVKEMKRLPLPKNFKKFWIH